MELVKWVRCPVCHSKTRTKICENTVLIQFPLYCPKCKYGHPNKSKLLHKHFSVRTYTPKIDIATDLVVVCSDSVQGLKSALNSAQHGGQVCVMSHLYGLDTSFVYEQACKKELRCYFPLRNGEQNNLLLAADYIDQYWVSEYDDMLTIYDDIDAAFKEKESSSFCKQIVRSSALSITEL